MTNNENNPEPRASENVDVTIGSERIWSTVTGIEPKAVSEISVSVVGSSDTVISIGTWKQGFINKVLLLTKMKIPGEEGRSVFC